MKWRVGMGEYFPMFVSLEGRRICIAGAGKIAARRAEVLLSFGAELYITAPDCCEEMQALLFGEADQGKCREEGLQKSGLSGQRARGEGLKRAGAGKFVYRKRRFEVSDLDGMDLMLAATDDTALNHEIALLCRERGLPVNNASCRSDCDFFFPAIVREEGLTIGVSSGGGDHRKVAQACGKLRRFFQMAFQDEEG